MLCVLLVQSNLNVFHLNTGAEEFDGNFDKVPETNKIKMKHPPTEEEIDSQPRKRENSRSKSLYTRV